MTLFFASIFTILLLWFFWGLYVLVMGIYRAHLSKRLNNLTMFLSIPFILVGYLTDVFVNLTIASFIFVEFPKEYLLTDRLQRYIKQKSGWRFKISRYVCDNFLDIFDPTGKHCD